MPTNRREYERLWRERNVAKVKASQKAWNQRNKTKVIKLARKAQLRQYGLTIEQFEKLLQLQNGVCAICHQPEMITTRGNARQLSVDHDHQTGKVRGLLCTKCNQAVGLMNDSSDRLRAAAVYLEKGGDDA